jgi:hypothetical protein
LGAIPTAEDRALRWILAGLVLSRTDRRLPIYKRRASIVNGTRYGPPADRSLDRCVDALCHQEYCSPRFAQKKALRRKYCLHSRHPQRMSSGISRLDLPREKNNGCATAGSIASKKSTPRTRPVYIAQIHSYAIAWSKKHYEYRYADKKSASKPIFGSYAYPLRLGPCFSQEITPSNSSSPPSSSATRRLKRSTSPRGNSSSVHHSSEIVSS